MDKLKNDIVKLMREVYPGDDRVLVFGEGPRGARLMLIGEAPGQQEALMGRPFVGKAGKNLDAYIEATGLKREEMYLFAKLFIALNERNPCACAGGEKRREHACRAAADNDDVLCHIILILRFWRDIRCNRSRCFRCC